MIKLNTTPDATDYNIASGTEAALLLDGVEAFFRNTTGRPIKPIVHFEISAKPANDLTDTATYKFRLYHGVSSTFASAAQVPFNFNGTLVNFLTYVCATAETLSPSFNMSFRDFVLHDDEFMFLAMESDDAADTEVRVTDVYVYEDTDATGYSATGLDPQVDVVSANDGALAGTADMKTQGEAALRTYEVDHFAAVQCEGQDITVHVANDTVFAKMMAEGGVIADYDEDTDSSEARRNLIDAINNLVKASGDGDLAAILGDTNEIQGKLPTNKFMGSSDGADDDGTLNTIATDTTTDIPALIATAQADLDTITGTGGALIGTDAMDRSGTLDVNTKTVTNDAITAAAIADAAIDNATFAADVGSTAYATNIIALAARKVMDELNLDHLMKVAVADRDALAEVVDDTVLANIMTKTDGDTSDFDHATDSLEGVRDSVSANYLSVLDILADTTTLTEEVQFSTTVGATVTSATIFNLTAGVANDDAYNDATICVMDDSNSSLAEWRTIVDYTGSTKTVTLDRALSFTPEASTDVVFITGKTRNNNVAGGSANTYTVTDDGTALGNAVPDVHVWVTSDLGGNTIIASGTTDSNGAVIFYLDAGKTYYIWKHKAGSTFEAQPEIAVAV